MMTVEKDGFYHKDSDFCTSFSSDFYTSYFPSFSENRNGTGNTGSMGIYGIRLRIACNDV